MPILIGAGDDPATSLTYTAKDEISELVAVPLVVKVMAVMLRLAVVVIVNEYNATLLCPGVTVPGAPLPALTDQVAKLFVADSNESNISPRLVTTILNCFLLTSAE